MRFNSRRPIKEYWNDIDPKGSRFHARYLDIDGLGATREVDDLHHPGDRYLSRISLLNIHRTSGSTGRLWTAVSKRRRPSEPHDTDGGQHLKRFTRCFSREKTPSAVHPVPESNTTIFRSLEL